jgi:hypothetical protein
MLLERKVVNVPAQRELDADRSEYGRMGVKTRGVFGAAAIEAGTPDFGSNGEGFEGASTDAVDAIANILHHLAYEFPDEDAEVVVESALEHFRHEIDDRD